MWETSQPNAFPNVFDAHEKYDQKLASQVILDWFWLDTFGFLTVL